MTILLISSDAIDTQMAGPGIRYWEFAKHLGQKHDVILLTPNRSTLHHPGIQLVQHTRRSLRAALRWADVVVTQGYLFALAPVFLTDKPLVIDLYDPLPIELLEHHAHLPFNTAQLSQSYCVERTQLLLRRGDFFLYSHERQRDYWLGLLTAVGRVNHQSYREDHALSGLFGCVPYGIADEAPQSGKSVLRGDQGPCDPDDTILLWGGGLWKWFDPLTVIRAMKSLGRDRQDIKLLFLGARRAKSDTTGINVAYATEEAIALSQELGLYNRTVFFHEEWVPYEEREKYFLDADIGLSTHVNTLETRLAFRTRILDYLWSGLPIITTTGDFLSELVEREQVGLTVPPGDVRAMKAAILTLAADHKFRRQCRENIQRVRQTFAWSEVMKPLDAFCSAPRRTSHLHPSTRWWLLLKFYAATCRHLIQYRGYQKMLTKIHSALTAKDVSRG